jgi:hypothetical protein
MKTVVIKKSGKAGSLLQSLIKLVFSLVMAGALSVVIDKFMNEIIHIQKGSTKALKCVFTTIPSM